MFLITPKASPNPATEPPVPSRPVAKISRARVQKACERCRLKKIKCDGVLPCIRCQQDGVICVVSKRDPYDHKAASRDYISALETQQKAFIATLQDISRNFPQAIDAVGIKEILDTAKSHGYEFEGIPERQITDSSEDISGADQCYSLKRRRADSHTHRDLLTSRDATTAAQDQNRTSDRNDGSGKLFTKPLESFAMSSAAFDKKQISQTAPESTAGSCAISGASDQITNIQDSLQLGEPAASLLPSFSTCASQCPKEVELWPLDQPLWNTNGEPAQENVQAEMAMSNTDWTTFQDDMGFNLATIPNSNDLLDCTLWWDPSTIYSENIDDIDNLDPQSYPRSIMEA